MAAPTNSTASSPSTTAGVFVPVIQKVAPPLIWMGIGFLAATWFYKPKRV